MNAFLFWIFIYSHMYCCVVIFIDMYTTFLTIIEFGFRHLKNYGDRGGCYLKSQICILTR